VFYRVCVCGLLNVGFEESKAGEFSEQSAEQAGDKMKD